MPLSIQGLKPSGFPRRVVKGGKNSRYHFNKWKECYEKDITLLQFWPDEYWHHKSIVRSKILYLCGLIESKINARNCKIAVLDNTENERSFLEANHIQGFPSYRQFSLGAYHNDQLVGLMSFANKQNRLELVRFATDINTRCVGLFSKMFKSAVKNFGLEGDVYSMSDNRVSNGNLYKAAGWSFVRNVPPSYCYTRDQYTREDKQHFRKEKLAKKFDLDPVYVAANTEWQIMQDLGYDRLWDAGKKLWRISV